MVAIVFMLLAHNASLKASTIIEGVVIDSLFQPMDVATVSLFRAIDTVFIKAELTNVDGKFEFADIPLL